ncbi:MAG: hypothetical protein WD737_13540 [Gemmatimonadota bacterium]
MEVERDIHQILSAAHAEALRVGDSPVYADRLAAKLPDIKNAVAESDLDENAQARIRDALDHADRVLKRDDDGREAARRLQGALALLRPRSRKPLPFLDDLEGGEA